jgi:hypothetical protein
MVLSTLWFRLNVCVLKEDDTEAWSIARLVPPFLDEIWIKHHFQFGLG